jgi:hypothetical protein
MTRPNDASPAPLNSHELPPPTTDGIDPTHPELGNADPLENSPTSRSSVTQQAFKRLYVILLVIGLSLGVVAAIGVVNLLNHWGLTSPPPPVEQPNR